MISPQAVAVSPRSNATKSSVSRTALHWFLFSVALGAAGCSESVSERSAACGQTDWRQYGQNDGRLGVPSSERQDYFERCRELGVPVDEAAYRQGRAEGLMLYCSVDGGYQAGIEGRRYRQVCSGQGDVAFRQGYEEGRKARRSSWGYPGPRVGVGVGIGSGGRTRTGIGVGFPIYYGSRRYHGGYPYWDDDDYCIHSPFPCAWHRGDFWGLP